MLINVPYFQKAVATLKNEGTPTELFKFADETLDYLKTREVLWKKASKPSKNRIVDFSPENLAQFYKEDLTTVKQCDEEPEKEDDNKMVEQNEGKAPVKKRSKGLAKPIKFEKGSNRKL